MLIRHYAVKSDRGFTMIELLTTIVILSVLAGLSIAAFFTYREKAEYQKAESDLRNAKTAFNAGALSLPSNYAGIDLTFTGSDGGPVTGEIAEILPGAVVSSGVNLGVSYDGCAAAELVPQGFIVARPCESSKYAYWTRFCNGVEAHVSGAIDGDGC